MCCLLNWANTVSGGKNIYSSCCPCTLHKWMYWECEWDYDDGVVQLVEHRTRDSISIWHQWPEFEPCQEHKKKMSVNQLWSWKQTWEGTCSSSSRSGHWRWRPTASQHNIFDSEKVWQVFLVLLMQTGFEPRVLDLESDALPTEPPRHLLLLHIDGGLLHLQGQS